jgi:hypothetical protein
MTLNERMNRFRIASRELFYNFVRVSGATAEASASPADAPSSGPDDPWDLERRFSHVEEVLFEMMVCEPAKLTHVGYRNLQTDIVVELNTDLCPVMLNREANSGYWDFPLHEISRDARLLFFRFFDWDILDYRDSRYVLVQVDDWPSHPEAVGKQGLIETQYVNFVPARTRRPAEPKGPAAARDT